MLTVALLTSECGVEVNDIRLSLKGIAFGAFLAIIINVGTFNRQDIFPVENVIKLGNRSHPHRRKALCRNKALTPRSISTPPYNIYKPNGRSMMKIILCED